MELSSFPNDSIMGGTIVKNVFLHTFFMSCHCHLERYTTIIISI
jgi:hypothetical protein